MNSMENLLSRHGAFAVVVGLAIVAAFVVVATLLVLTAVGLGTGLGWNQSSTGRGLAAVAQMSAPRTRAD